MTSTDFTDLVQAAQNGDRAAFERLMARFHDRAFAVALSQTGNYHQAEDAVQEAFVEAYLRLDRLQSPPAFPAWLQKIVRGKCVRVLRTGKSVVAPVSLDSLTDAAASGDAADPLAALLARSAGEVLRDALRLLAPQEREALLLFAIGGYRYDEIAEAMEIPLSMVRRRIYTARQRLRSSAELTALRPSSRQAEIDRGRFARRVAERERAHRQEPFIVIKERKEMSETIDTARAVDLVGPGIENRQVIKNLYAFYREDARKPLGLPQRMNCVSPFGGR